MDILSLCKFHIYLLSCMLVLTHSVPTSSPSLSTYASLDNGSIIPESHNAMSFGHLSAIAFRVEDGWSEMDSGVLYIYSDMKCTLRLVGTDFGTKPLALAFTTNAGSKGLPCDDLRSTGIFQSSAVEGHTAFFDVILSQWDQVLYFCIRGENQTMGKSQFVHLGNDPWMSLGLKVKPVKSYILPFWIQIIVVVILLIFSGLFSGLNLGLMSLDQTELNIMIASGTAREKQYAKTIMPLRKRGNFLLCTILLGNVLVNNCLTILLDDLTGSGWMAIVGATLAIVIFGEILPQAICSRYGLAVGARTIWFTRFFMMLTFPLSFPISLILDRFLGEEIGYVYNRDRLRELLKLAEKDIGLVTDEVNIITGALELSKKTVAHIMTKIDDVFMIEYNSVLDFETVTKIMDSGYTRIPVYEKDRSNVVALLNTKDLAFVDPDDKIPLNTVTRFYNHILLFVFEDVKLDIILQDFKKGGSHMAMVQSVVSDGPGDPYYKVVGLVTLEDVIEEIIQSEIYDEFDTVTDNRLKQPRGIRQKDYSVFNVPSHHNLPRLTPQLQLASFQFLSGTLTPFKLPYISERILYKLMSQDIVLEQKQQPGDPPFYLYQHGRPADYFVLVVQGRVLVQSGLEHLTYEAGSFSYFGLQSLLVKGGRSQGQMSDMSTLYKSNPNVSNPNISDSLPAENQSRTHQSSLKSRTVDLTLVPATGPFIPDFTVRALTNLQYLKITREQYLIAYRASQLEQEILKGNITDSPEETFEREWKSCNMMFLDNTIDTKSGKHNSSVGHVSSPSHASANTPQGASNFFQQVRRTLGFSYYSQNDSVNISTKQDGSPSSTKASTPPSRLKGHSSTFGSQGTTQKKGVKWSQNEMLQPSVSQARKSSIVLVPSQEQSTGPDKTKSSDKKVNDQGKSNHDNNEKDAPSGGNLSSNNVPDDSGEPLPRDENSKMETEALLQDLEQIEVKVVRP